VVVDLLDPAFQDLDGAFTKGSFLLVGETAADDVLEPVRDQAGDLSEDGRLSAPLASVNASFTVSTAESATLDSPAWSKNRWPP